MKCIVVTGAFVWISVDVSGGPSTPQKAKTVMCLFDLLKCYEVTSVLQSAR